MKKLAYIYATSWDKEELHIEFSECHQDHFIPLGTAMLNLPDDIIPKSNDTWNSMVNNHKVKTAKRMITECQVKLQQAEDNLSDLLALPPSVGADPVSYGFDKSIPF